MRALALVAALALVLVGCPAPEAGGRGGLDPLDARWLESAKIRGDDLARLAALGKSDPEVSALFAEATRDLGGSFDALAAHMTICAPDVTQEGGLTLVEGYNAIFARSIEEVVAGSTASPAAEAGLKSMKLPVRASRRVDEPDAIRLDLVLMPKICFVERLSVGEAYEAVIHELVHALRYNPHEIVAIAVSSPDEATFLRRVVLARGGEAEAYAIATRARLKIPGGHYLAPLTQVVDVRSPTPVSPEAMADAILSPRPRGLGYADGILRGKYQEAIVKAREELGNERGFYDKVLGQRREFLAYLGRRSAVDQNNLGVFEHNAEVGRQRGDPAFVAENLRRRAETEKSLAQAKAMTDVANASIARLTQRLAEIDQKLGAAR